MFFFRSKFYWKLFFVEKFVGNFIPSFFSTFFVVFLWNRLSVIIFLITFSVTFRKIYMFQTQYNFFLKNSCTPKLWSPPFSSFFLWLWFCFFSFIWDCVWRKTSQRSRATGPALHLNKCVCCCCLSFVSEKFLSTKRW